MADWRQPGAWLFAALAVALGLLGLWIVALGGPEQPRRWLEAGVWAALLLQVLQIVWDSLATGMRTRSGSEALSRGMRGAGDGPLLSAVATAGGLLVFPISSPAAIAAYAALCAAAFSTALVGLWLFERAGGWQAAAGEERRPDPTRRALAVLAIAPVVATLLFAAWATWSAPPVPQFACPLLPNGVVPRGAALPADCALEPFDRVVEVWVPGDRGPFVDLADLRARAERWPEFVEWTVVRGGRRIVADVPLLQRPREVLAGRFLTALMLSGILLATGLIIFWNTSAAAATPFLLFYAQVSVALTGVLCGASSQQLYLAAALATCFFPPTLVHLALAFPRASEALRRVPSLPWVYYAFSGVLCILEVAAFRRSAEVWMLVNGLIPIYAFAAWSSVMVGSLLALRQSTSRLERSRARAVVFGTLGIAVVGLGAAGVGSSRSTLSMSLLTIIFLPLPVGVAIVRYHLFDLRLRLRRIISYLLYNATTAALVSVTVVGAARALDTPVPLGDGGLLFSGVLIFLLATDPLRGWLLTRARDWVDAAGRRRRGAAGRCAQQLAELRDPDACAQILGEAITDGVRASWVAVYLGSSETGLRPAWARGEGAAIELDLARRADSLARERVVHLARAEGAGDPDVRRLDAAGVDVILPVASASGRAGLALIGERVEALPYSLEELEFLRTLAAQAAIALDNARLARELVDAGRSAARGNLAVGLAHELGKPLRVIEDIASGLEQRLDDPVRARRDVASIAEISGDLIRTVYGFVGAARRERERRGAELSDVVGRATHAVERIHGPERVSISLPPDLPTVRGADELATVLTNLLDNALLASGGGEAVHLFATADRGGVRIEVVDDGHGMDAATAARAFDLFFTTRRARGGSGVGLALCREIVSALGGSLELGSQPGKGTRVTLWLPGQPEAEPRTGPERGADRFQPVATDRDRSEPKKAT